MSNQVFRNSTSRYHFPLMEADLSKANIITNYDDGDNVKINDILKPYATDTFDLGTLLRWWKYVYAQRYYVDDLNFYLSLESGNPTITLDSGDFIEYDRTGNEFRIKINGNPNPDFSVKNGIVKARNKFELADSTTYLEKTTTGGNNGNVNIMFNTTKNSFIQYIHSSTRLQIYLNNLMVVQMLTNSMEFDIGIVFPQHNTWDFGNGYEDIKDMYIAGNSLIGDLTTGSGTVDDHLHIRSTGEVRSRVETTTSNEHAGYLSKNPQLEVFTGVGDTIPNYMIYNNTLGYGPIRCFSTERSVKIGDESIAGSNTPDAKAVLEIRSIERGFLIPRMTTIQKNAITSPTNSLQVHDSTRATNEYQHIGNWISMPNIPSIGGNNLTQITSITTTVASGNGMYATIRTVSSSLAALSTTSFTITNNFCTANSHVLLTIRDYSGTYMTNGIPQIHATNVNASGFDVIIINSHASNALNGTIQFSFMLIEGK